VADIAQHLIAILCFAQNGYAIYNDVNGRKITGLCGAGMAGCRRAEPHRPVSHPARAASA
jgi:hypothetical protein